MTTIEKEKTLDVVRQMVADGQVSQEVAEKYFPELKSEDERIMKSLSAYFAKFKPNDMWDDDFSFGDIVAWLDRLGKQKQLIERGKWYVCIETYKFFVKGSAYQARNRYCINGDGDDCFVDGHDGKLSDYFRPWIIQDAKDGDVLSYKDEISLYKHDIKNCTKEETTFGGFVYHCCYDGKRFVVDSLYSLTEQDKMDIHPATKEQRDQLEKAMADAGYRWNPYEKKMEKIEQNPAWSEEDEAGLGDAMWAIEQARTIAKDENDMGNLWYAERWLKSLKDRYAWKPSKEQMEVLAWCRPLFADPKSKGILESLINDLKKLREK